MKKKKIEKGKGWNCSKSSASTFGQFPIEESHAGKGYQSSFAEGFFLDHWRVQKTEELLNSLSIFSNFFVPRSLADKWSHLIIPGPTGTVIINPAMELRRVGIHFKPSKTSLFTSVHFKSTVLAGRHRIPPLTIHDSNKSLLVNLVT
jgi:hypothetical protein